jgi:3-oxoacyl-[acyl-carrier-protein] synthase II
MKCHHDMSERRVVITGIGVVSPTRVRQSTRTELFWKNIERRRQERHPPHPVDGYQKYDCKIAGEVVDFDPTPSSTTTRRPAVRTASSSSAMAASKMAAKDAGAEPGCLDPHRVGVMVGSGIGGLSTIETQYEILLNKALRVSPFLIPMMITNIASGMIATEFGFMGPNMASSPPARPRTTTSAKPGASSNSAMPMPSSAAARKPPSAPAACPASAT